MSARLGAALAAIACAAPAVGGAYPAPRDTARIGPPGASSVGVFNPLTHVPVAGVELSTHPLVGLVAPNVVARFHVYTDPKAPLTLALETGLSLPGGAFGAAPPFGVKGYLTPSCKVTAAEPDRAPDDCDRPGAFLVPALGLAASYGRDIVTTARLDVAAGWLLDGERPPPRDTWAPLDLLLAPVFNRWRAHVGVRFDHPVFDFLRVAVEAHAYRVGEVGPPGRSPWTFVGHLGTDWQTSAHTRLTAGAMYWNSDQRRVDLVKDADGYSHFERVRSHDFGPTLDFLWFWGG